MTQKGFEDIYLDNMNIPAELKESSYVVRDASCVLKSYRTADKR
jgi:hypothetical protein